MLPHLPLIVKLKIRPKQKKQEEVEKDSSLIQDLNNVCNKALEGWKSYSFQEVTGRLRIDQVREENIDIFLNKTVPTLSFEIKNIIDGLIKFDNYLKDMFDDYEGLYEKIKKTDDIEKRARLFRELLTVAKSIIPQSVEYVRPKLITPAIGNEGHKINE